MKLAITSSEWRCPARRLSMLGHVGKNLKSSIVGEESGIAWMLDDPRIAERPSFLKEMMEIAVRFRTDR